MSLPDAETLVKLKGVGNCFRMHLRGDGILFEQGAEESCGGSFESGNTRGKCRPLSDCLLCLSSPDLLTSDVVLGKLGKDTGRLPKGVFRSSLKMARGRLGVLVSTAELMVSTAKQLVVIGPERPTPAIGRRLGFSGSTGLSLTWSSS